MDRGVLGEVQGASIHSGPLRLAGPCGWWPAERFRVHGVTYSPSEKVKSELYRSLLPLLNSGRAKLLDVLRLGLATRIS